MTATRRTKRRYAHELYPHPEEGEVRPLAVDVLYLYGQAIGLEVDGTDWHELLAANEYDKTRAATDRTMRMIAAREIALIADALHQGMSGDEAWAWAQHRANDESGEIVGYRAAHYGIDYDAIKPYPVRAEATTHDHLGGPDAHGWRTVTRVKGRESECEVCTEPAEAGDTK